MAHPLTRIKNFSYDSLVKEIQLENKNNKPHLVFWEAYCGDYWQKGNGAIFPAATGKNASIITKFLERRFVFRNVIKECVERVAGAFFGKAPNWRYAVSGLPTESGVAEDGSDPFAEIDQALSDFWVKQKVAEVFADAFESRLVFGRGGIRLYIPAKFRRTQSQEKNTETPNLGTEVSEVEDAESEKYTAFPDIVSAIQAMRVEFISPTASRLLEDDGDYFSVVNYEIRENWELKKNTKVVEFSFVDNSNMTFIGLLKENDGVGKGIESVELSSGFDLAGFPTFNEFNGKPYVTDALYKCNQLLNLALSCAGFCLVDNGFGEMVLTNVALKMKKVLSENGEEIEIPENIERGGGAVQNFVGIEQYNEQTGDVSVASPGVTFKEPSPLTAFKDGKDMAYAACLEEAGQLYALISGDATASGESRIQALADFVLKIRPYKYEVDEQGSWLMTVVLLWAAALSEQGETYAGTTVVFDSRMHVANLSEAEKRIVMDMRKNGAISRETERVLLGIDDPGLEAEKILQEQALPPDETTVDEFSAKLDVGLKMLSCDIDPTTIQKYLGYTDDEIAAMQEIAAQRNVELAAQFSGGPTGGPEDQLPPPDQGAAAGA